MHAPITYAENEEWVLEQLSEWRQRFDVQLVSTPADLDSDLGSTVVDLSGLTKESIFHATRAAARQRESWIVHTEPIDYFPREQDLAAVTDPELRVDEQLAAYGEVLSGEHQPYTLKRLNTDFNDDDSRQRALIAASTAKHMRLMTLLTMRDFDHLAIFVPAPYGPREELARLAASLSAASQARELVEVTTPRLGDYYTQLVDLHHRLFRDAGHQVEVGLTGDKLHAAAAALASLDHRFASSWYVSPAKWDKERFSEGVGRVTTYRISRAQPG